MSQGTHHSDSPGIRFNNCWFSEPVSLAAWDSPKYAGLFVLLVRDPNWAPKPFQPLYFGEFGNNTPLPALLRDYPLVMAAAKGRALYISVLAIPFSTTAQRLELCNELIWAYNPECRTDTHMLPQRELAIRLSELEKKHSDQTAQFTLLLANLNQPFQLPPETPRRRIGFMPQPEPAAS